MAALTITKLHPSLGAEIAGIDLSQPIDAALQEVLSQALAGHLALVFRDQRLRPPHRLAAAAAFRTPMWQRYPQNNMATVLGAGLVWHVKGPQPAEQWHTDHAHAECPPAATLLYGVRIPAIGGATSVANMRAAYAALAEDERRRLDTLRTVNARDGNKTDTRAEGRPTVRRPAVHPMVRMHPVHGTRAVSFDVTKAVSVEGMTPEASQRHMNDLLERMIRPEIVYHHAWRKGNVLVIDNRATMHRAHGDDDRSKDRLVWRVLAEGDPPRLM